MDFDQLLAPKSDEQHRAVSQRWLSFVKPTLIDQWPAELTCLSIPTKLVPVPDGLLAEFWGLHEDKRPGPVMSALAQELDSAMEWERKFVRLRRG